MGLSYQFDNSLCTVLAEGEFDVNNIRSVFSEICSEHESGEHLLILIVDPGSSFNPNAADMRRIVDDWVTIFEGIHVRIALLVTRQVHYGMGRMASVFAEDNRLPFAVFHDRGEAATWLLEYEQS